MGYMGAVTKQVGTSAWGGENLLQRLVIKITLNNASYKTVLRLLNENNAEYKTGNTGTGPCEGVSVGREPGTDELGSRMLLFARIRHASMQISALRLTHPVIPGILFRVSGQSWRKN